jgi:hypothetical protein
MGCLETIKVGVPPTSSFPLLSSWPHGERETGASVNGARPVHAGNLRGVCSSVTSDDAAHMRARRFLVPFPPIPPEQHGAQNGLRPRCLVKVCVCVGGKRVRARQSPFWNRVVVAVVHRTVPAPLWRPSIPHTNPSLPLSADAQESAFAHSRSSTSCAPCASLRSQSQYRCRNSSCVVFVQNDAATRVHSRTTRTNAIRLRYGSCRHSRSALGCTCASTRRCRTPMPWSARPAT